MVSFKRENVTYQLKRLNTLIKGGAGVVEYLCIRKLHKTVREVGKLHKRT